MHLKRKFAQLLLCLFLIISCSQPEDIQKNKETENLMGMHFRELFQLTQKEKDSIKKDSIKIIKRTAGYFKESHLNGNIAYDLSCIAEICNPTQDSIIKCVIKAKNNLGLRAIGTFEDMSILEVIIPRITSGIQSEINIDDVNIGDNVNVRVCGKKFTLYDKMISIVGKIIKDKQEIIEIVEDIEEDNQSDFEEQEDDDDFIDILNKEDEEDENENEDEEDEDIKRIKIDAIDLSISINPSTNALKRPILSARKFGRPDARNG